MLSTTYKIKKALSVQKKNHQNNLWTKEKNVIIVIMKYYQPRQWNCSGEINIKFIEAALDYTYTQALLVDKWGGRAITRSSF